MSFFILVLVLNTLAGFGLMASLRTRLPRTMSIPLAPLVGMFLHTLALIVVDLLPWGIGPGAVTVSALGTVILTHLRWGAVRTWYTQLFARPVWTLKMYDVVLIVGVLITAYIVSWASWFWPVTPFDAMAGIDLVARQTVTEGTINNRVFTDPSLSGHLSNQPFYAPFAMLMQVVYRILGFGYGQVWLAVSAICFSAFLLGAMRQLVHPFLAGVLWLLAILTPEFLGYTYLLQTDYLNAVFFASAVTLVAFTVERKDVSALLLAAVLFAAACWSRTETILFVGMGLAASAPYMWRKLGQRAFMRFALVAGGLSAVTFAVWNGLYLQMILPVRPDTAQELTGFAFGRFADVVSDLVTKVMMNTDLWGVAFPLFIVVILVSVYRFRSLQPAIPLIWIGIVVVGLSVVGTIFTAAIVEQTLRRGIFKIIPLMYLAVAWTPLMRSWGKRLQEWETGH